MFGPFFIEGSPAFENGDDLANGAPGMPCFMSGTVRSTDGEPVPGALLDIWQADEDGFYDVQYADLDEARGRGHLHSDDEGRYWFWTVQPEAYPIPTDGPVGGMLAATSRSPMRPAHVHFKVTAPGYQNAHHPRLRRERRVPGHRRGVRRAQLAAGDLRAPRARHGARRARDGRAVPQRALRPDPGAGGVGRPLALAALRGANSIIEERERARARALRSSPPRTAWDTLPETEAIPRSSGTPAPPTEGPGRPEHRRLPSLDDAVRAANSRKAQRGQTSPPLSAASSRADPASATRRRRRRRAPGRRAARARARRRRGCRGR